jgi:hypothetical protein
MEIYAAIHPSNNFSMDRPKSHRNLDGAASNSNVHCCPPAAWISPHFVLREVHVNRTAGGGQIRRTAVSHSHARTGPVCVWLGARPLAAQSAGSREPRAGEVTAVLDPIQLGWVWRTGGRLRDEQATGCAVCAGRRLPGLGPRLSSSSPKRDS